MKQFFSRGSRTPRGNSQSPDAAQTKPDLTLSASGAAAARSGSRLGPTPPSASQQAQKPATALDLDSTPRLGQQQRSQQQQQQQPQRDAVNTGSNYVPALALTPRGGRGNTPQGSRRDSADRRRSREAGGQSAGAVPSLGRHSGSCGSGAPEAPGSGEISARSRSHPQACLTACYCAVLTICSGQAAAGGSCQRRGN